MLLLIDRVATGTWSLVVFIRNVALIVCIAFLDWTGKLASGSPTNLGVIDIKIYYTFFWP